MQVVLRQIRKPQLVFAFLLAACAPPPTPIPVTLTPPSPTSTPAPVPLLPTMEIGATFAYADGTTLAAVPSGEFVMGHGTAENPEHRVILSDYWIYSTEVTNIQYALCVAQGRCSEPDPADNPLYRSFDHLNRPVVGVTHEQARAYCAFMGGDLPTEAQWEKAARGDDGRRYPWGDEEPTCELLNFDNCLKDAADVTHAPKGRSPYSTLNMAGNVYEWVSDWYDPVYYESGPAGDPSGPPSGSARVIRSSGYRSSADQSLTYARSYSSPNDHRPDLGFRCVVGDPGSFAPACEHAPVLSLDQLSGVDVDCPAISIDVLVTECRYGGGAVVTFQNDHPTDPNASFGGIVGCTLQSGRPGAYPLTYECRQASTALMSSSCTYSGIPRGNCPSPYSLDPATSYCRWPGGRASGIDCPTGQFFDPVAYCCRNETGEVADFPVCPVGTLFIETAPDLYSCLPAEAARPAPEVSAPVNPPVCGNLCELTVELCNIRNLVFCPTTCTCLAVGRKCPEP